MLIGHYLALAGETGPETAGLVTTPGGTPKFPTLLFLYLSRVHYELTIHIEYL